MFDSMMKPVTKVLESMQPIIMAEASTKYCTSYESREKHWLHEKHGGRERKKRTKFH